MDNLFACKKCKIKKPRTYENFYGDDSSADGFRKICKPCFILRVVKNKLKRYGYYAKYNKEYQRHYRSIKVGGA